MKNRFRKLLAGVLLAGMVFGSMPVYAAETEAAGTAGESQAAQEEAADQEAGSAEESLGEAQTDADVSSEADASSQPESQSADVAAAESGTPAAGEINYVYIESPYLETPGTQRIAFAFDSEIAGADRITLTVADAAGNTEEWELSAQSGSLYLFEKAFTGEAYTDTYRAVSLNLYGAETTQTLNLSGLGVEAEFGVNEAYEGIEELMPVDAEQESESPAVEANVVTIDENGVTQAQDSIEDALSVAAAGTAAGISTYSADSGAESRAGKNIVVALDPGHDANDAGAQSNGLKEEVLTLKIANYCKQELEQYAGVSVYMTRTGLECPYNCTSAGECIAQRAEAAAAAGASIYVSFHLNASTSSAANGAEIIVPNYNWKYEVGAEGHALAQEILDELTALGLSNRGIYSKDTTIGETYPDGSLSDYFSVMIYNKENDIPGIIVEHAFITNSGDVNSFLTTESGLQKLGVADATGIANYLGLVKGSWQYVEGQGWKFYMNGSYVTNQWLYVGTAWYYFDANGIMKTGWVDVNGEKYYFDDDGAMHTGWLYDAGKWYFFSESGAMQTGWIATGGAWYYIGEDGVMMTGLQTIEGKEYYFNGSGAMVTGWVEIDGQTYYFSGQGKHTGWVVASGKWYYLDSKGIKQTGWQTIGGTKYYFDNTGAMYANSWLYYDSKWYYLNEDGSMYANDWLYLGGSWFYLGEDGAAYTGWHTINGKTYYFNSSAYMLTGTQTIDGKVYQFDSSGALINSHPAGWSYEDGKWYYYDSNGNRTTGWQYVGGTWYYMNSDGVMVTGWQAISNVWYYFNGSGAMYANSWLYDGGKWYYFNGSGAMYANSWLYLGGSWFYLGGDGAAYTGWHTINGKTYYFNGSAYMLTGTQTIDGVTYQFDSSGALVGSTHSAGWSFEDGKWYYYDANGNKTTGWQYVGGTWYYMNSNGVMVTGWQTIGNVRYYFNASGAMYANSWLYDGGKWYYFNGSGAMYANSWLCLGGSWFYLGGDGAAYTGWHTINGKTYYFNGSAYMLTGTQTIDGIVYEFASSGELVKSYVEGTYLIQNDTSVTVGQMVRFFENSGYEYPAEALSKGGAADLETFCRIFYEEAQAEGIAAEVAFAQSMLETGWLQFGGAVKIEQFNFAGIGAVDGGTQGADFSSYGENGVRMGVRAQIQHLKAYASDDPLNNECVDPRFSLVTRGTAKYVEWLGQKENPDGYGWATAAGYGLNIFRLIENLKAA